MNNAEISKLIWFIASGRDNLWVDWMKATYLKEDSLWTAKITSACSSAWRAILKVRPLISNKIKSNLGPTVCPFSIARAWNAIKTVTPRVRWANAIWFPLNVPRHAFTTWRCLLDSLATADQLQKRNIVVPDACVFYWAGKDSRDYLFWVCEYAFYIWKQILELCHQFHYPDRSVEKEAKWVAKISSKEKTIGMVGKIAFGATIYRVWGERNSRIFRNTSSAREVVVQKIKDDIKLKIRSMKFQSPTTACFSHLIQRWDLDVT
ncbi:hypothetical protein NE237_015955 [Protea cynaroides]|uniref:Reverse transcriptase zinc-binding domain-containing protein n=1 Tax=Protea cynaroides TaxID=273540 RepID=A0A9Q0QRP7_9MAGN|nr:hypothetical protein NE237_015955 [Protea cynaroides]